MTRPTPLTGNDIPFTREAVAAWVSGIMVVRCVITTEGLTRQCRVLQSVPLMDQPVLDALHRHRSVPVRFEGRPVNVEYTYTIRLKMPQKAAPKPTDTSDRT